MADLQADQFLGFRGRGRHSAWGSRQVDKENLKLSISARRQRGLKPFVEFLSGEPPVPSRDSELLHDLVAVLVRHAQVTFVRHQFSRHISYCNASGTRYSARGFRSGVDRLATCCSSPISQLAYTDAGIGVRHG